MLHQDLICRLIRRLAEVIQLHQLDTLIRRLVIRTRLPHRIRLHQLDTLIRHQAIQHRLIHIHRHIHIQHRQEELP